MQTLCKHRIAIVAACALAWAQPLEVLAQKTTALPTATTADTADLMEFVDVSDTTTALTGRNKKITLGNLSLSLPALNASALTAGTVPDARLSANVLLGTGTYADPAWLTALSWAKLTGKPTTLAGFGITDAQPLDSDLTSIAALSTTAFGRGLLTESSATTARATLGAEASLGNPGTNGYLLSSSAAGVRSWVPAPTFDSTNVAITGGTIDGTSIGATTASAGKFTTLSVNTDGSTATPSISFGSGGGYGFYKAATSDIRVVNNGVDSLRISNTNVAIASSGGLAFAANGLTTLDTILLRDGAANTLALRNGTNPQKFFQYNTWSDVNNWERASAGNWSSNAFFVGTEALGTGVRRTLGLVGHTTAIYTGVSGTQRWTFDNNGHLSAFLDNAYDIGLPGANRPRNLNLAGNVIFSSVGALVGSGDLVKFGGTGATNQGLKSASTVSLTTTVTIASPGVFTTASAHGFVIGDIVTLSTTGALPSGLSAARSYYVQSTPTTTTFTLATTLGGSAIDTTGTQTGTHTVNRANALYVRSADNTADAGLVAGPLSVGTVTTSGPVNGWSLSSNPPRISNGSFYAGPDIGLGASTWGVRFGDAYLMRDAADTLAMRNGTNAQTFRVFGSYTDSSNYWTGELKASGSNITLGFKHAGTGTSAINAVEIAGYNQVLLSTQGTLRWWVNSSGLFGPTSDNINDFGSSSGRIKNGYFGTSVNTPKVTLSETVTPTGTADVQGGTGDMRYDDNFIYLKTSAGWKRASLSTF